MRKNTNMNAEISKFSRPPIIIVSGLPRSGTSLMMKMLDFGGIDILTDHLRTADGDNPEGYYEFERVKKLPQGDTSWLEDANGKVVKVISALLEYLPNTYNYEIIFMQRNLQETLTSQQKMLENRGQVANTTPQHLIEQAMRKHLALVERWLSAQSNIKKIDINYNQLIREPEPLLANIGHFLERQLDTSQMLKVIRPDLYRNRS